MKLYTFLFVLFAASTAITGPLIDSTSGADIVELMASVAIFGSTALGLLFGILAVRKSEKSKGVKIALYFLVIIAMTLLFFAGAIGMGM